MTFTSSTTAGTTQLAYQWYYNAVTSLDGETNASLTLSALDPTNAGSYTVVVTNFWGATTSSVATLTVSNTASGAVQVTILPPGAVTAGAMWQVDGGTPQVSGATVTYTLA